MCKICNHVKKILKKNFKKEKKWWTKGDDAMLDSW